MTTRAGLAAAVAVLSLLFIYVPPSDALSLASLADKAGLPYPQDSEGTIFLRQASVFLEVQSRWGSVEGYPPWHSVWINQTAFYVLENSGTRKTINVIFPLLTSHTQSGNGLVFHVDGIAMNYSGMRWVQVLDDEGLCCLETLELYWLTLSFPAGARTNITVQVPQGGAAGRVALYTFFMVNASRWAAPLESLILSFHVNGGALASSTVPASANTTSTAIWSMTNQIPSQDLAISWVITEPEPPLRPFSIFDIYSFIATGLAVAIAGATVALLYLKRRKTGRIKTTETLVSLNT